GPVASASVGRAGGAPATRASGEPVVLKVGMPHVEAAQEVDGLRYWAGDPVVRLLDAEHAAGAMLLERCMPGTSLRERPPEEQDRVVAGMLRRMWRPRRGSHAFRPLSYMIDAWCAESRAQ